jgi:hypothetical protein
MAAGKRDPVTHRTPAQAKKHRETYQARPDVVADRVKMNQARAKMIDAGKAKKGDDKDVNHKRPLRHGGSNDIGNLESVSRSKNRGWEAAPGKSRRRSK